MSAGRAWLDAPTEEARRDHCACPICNERGKGSLLFEKELRRYIKCLKCNFVFSVPRPSEAYLDSLYDEIGGEYFTNPDMLRFQFAPNRFRRELGLVERFLPRGSRVLDVGCCTGAFVKACLDAGYEMEGIDISLAAVRQGQGLGLPVRREQLLSYDAGNKYDAVCMWATLEHVSDPVALLRKAWDILRPGGWLLASVPNFSSFSQWLLGKRYNLVSKEHLNYFTPPVFSKVVFGSGFLIVHTTSFSFNPVAVLRDMMRRQEQPTTREQIRLSNVTRMIRATPLHHLQRLAENLLNRMSHRADVLAVAAKKTE